MTKDFLLSLLAEALPSVLFCVARGMERAIRSDDRGARLIFGKLVTKQKSAKNQTKVYKYVFSVKTFLKML
jgi:hypothetical protein